MAKNDQAIDVSTLPKSVVIVRANRILEAGLRFHEFLWFGKRDKVRKYLKENPEEARYKFASFNQWMSRALPVKILHQTTGPGQKVSPEDIAAMNPTPAELRKLAGLDRKDDDE